MAAVAKRLVASSFTAESWCDMANFSGATLSRRFFVYAKQPNYYATVTVWPDTYGNTSHFVPSSFAVTSKDAPIF